MRRLIILGIIALAALQACAQHRVTVNQLEQTLSTSVSKHRNDTDIARQLGNLQLSERLTDHARDRLIASFALQSHAALALELLADESAPLDPPGNERPATAAPDAAAQQSMLAAAHAYVLDTVPRLPNFFATRSTVRFDDSAQVQHAGEWPVRAGFHLVGNTSRTVTMRDGQEVTDSPQPVSAKPEQIMGLYSFGEFGPILARTLADLSKGKVQFSHWEDSPLGAVAVFRYSVPRHESHYQVHFCCLLDQEYQGGQSYHNRNMPRYHTGDRNPIETTGLNAYDATPPYHGTLAIDPASGAIVRLTLDAELDPESAITRASTVVEYSRVVIGDQPFVCPARSLAISSQQGQPPAGEEVQRVPILSINETTFTEYHRLGSTSRLVAAAPLPADASPKSESIAPDPAPGAREPDVDAAGPTGVRESLLQAAGRPEETREIAVSAVLAPTSQGFSIDLKIAAADLGMRQEAGRWLDKLDVFLVQQNDAGARSHAQSLTIDLHLKDGTYQEMLGAGIPFRCPLQIQPGMTSMRVLVLDENTGRIGSVTIPSSQIPTAGQSAFRSQRAETP
jgi:hypothetical protein